MILKHRDKDLLRFEWLEPQGVRIVSVNESERRFLPLDFKGGVSEKNLWKWLSVRLIPRNRRNVEVLVTATGLDSRNVRGIIEICRGLSLNDVFGATQKVGTVNSANSESLALQIVANIKADPFASYEELSDILGIPRRTLARRIKELVSAGLIRRSGAAKNGHWEIVEGVAE